MRLPATAAGYTNAPGAAGSGRSARVTTLAMGQVWDGRATFWGAWASGQGRDD
jgi:hypothetical protein